MKNPEELDAALLVLMQQHDIGAMAIVCLTREDGSITIDTNHLGVDSELEAVIKTIQSQMRKIANALDEQAGHDLERLLAEGEVR